jgi:signal transduction histidine kinase
MPGRAVIDDGHGRRSVREIYMGLVPAQGIDDPAKLRRLMTAMLLIEGDLSLPVLLEHLVDEARSLVGARYGAMGVLNEDHTGLAELITVGIDADDEERIGDCLTGRGALELLMANPEPLRLADTREHPDSFGAASEHPAATSFLGVPVKVREKVYGDLCLMDKVGWSEFTQEDEELVIGLATAAGIAIENVRLHERVQQLAVLDERDRIARDLHDSVIQRLFAVGLSVQGMVKLARSTALDARLTKVVAEVDDAIHQIRSTIFELGLGGGDGVRSDLLALIRELNQVLGLEVQFTSGGPIDATVTERVAEHLLAAVREALTNIGRHAQATTAAVNLRVTDGWCRLEVVDNGVGQQAGAETAGGRQGVANLRHRAEELNGGLLLEQPEAGGTRLLWWVPLSV